MNVRVRDILLGFTKILIILCIVSLLFFDDVIREYLNMLDYTLVETMLRIGLIVGVIIVCFLWVSVYFMVVSNYKQQIKEKQLKQEQYINRYMQSLNGALNDLGCDIEEELGFEAVKGVEDALLLHLSDNELNQGLKQELPKFEDLIQALFCHIKVTLRNPINAKRKDVKYAFRMMYLDSKIARACKAKGLYPKCFEGLNLDMHLLRGNLIFEDITFRDCVFHGDWHFKDLSFNQSLDLEQCFFEGNIVIDTQTPLLLTVNKCGFKGQVCLRISEETPKEKQVLITNCTFAEAVTFEGCKIDSLCLEDTSLCHGLTFVNIKANVFKLERLVVLGGISFKSVLVESVLSLNHVQCDEPILLNDGIAGQGCEIFMSETHINNDSFMWVTGNKEA